MKFVPTNIGGVIRVELEPHHDARGSFVRSFCVEEFSQAGIAFSVAQANVSVNHHRATLRGLHFQANPYGEAKLVRCTRGKIWDVAVDLRQGSPSYLAWYGIELSQEGVTALYIPPGCAHGFITLVDDSVVDYLMGAAYVPEASRGVRWDDPTLAVRWPIHPEHVSARDAMLPLLDGCPAAISG